MSRSAQVSGSPVEESPLRGRSDGEDYISNLPESVISHILSRLTTRNAVRTCVLSKDWEYKWTFIYNIDIYDLMRYSSQRNKKTSFVDFVERTLLLSGNIKDFSLRCGGKYNLGSRIAAWMNSVLIRNVESFELVYHEEGTVLPCSLHNNSSLRKLRLHIPCTFRVPSENYFPNLKSLYLCEVNIQNELVNTDTLIFTFPVLEIFMLTKCKWLNVNFVEIFAPALTTFRSEIPDYAPVDDYSIKIFGPRLVKFQSYGDLLENFILNKPPVVKAVLHHDNSQLAPRSGLQCRRLLNEFSILEELELTVWVTEAIAQSKQGLALPRFNKLRKLILRYGSNVEALIELLHSAPYLKILIIDMHMLNDYDYDAVESVPSCIISHLEEVELYRIHANTHHVNLTKFLLKNGAKLKKLHVCAWYSVVRNAYIKQLPTFPKASSCLSVVVVEEKRR